MNRRPGSGRGNVLDADGARKVSMANLWGGLMSSIGRLLVDMMLLMMMMMNRLFYIYI